MNERNPLVSVIIPIYNGARFLGEALDSIVQQVHRPLEIIVIDDGSTDDSTAIASSYSDVHVLRKAHSGIAPTLNHGIRHATGDLLASLDADDRWTPNKLALQTAALLNNPDLDMVYGQCHQFTVKIEGGKRREILLGQQPGIGRSGMLIWSEAFLRVGLFTESGGRHHFLDWYARSREIGLRSVVLDEVVFERRIHDRNIGRTQPAEQRASYLRTLRQSLERRRRQEAAS